MTICFAVRDRFLPHFSNLHGKNYPVNSQLFDPKTNLEAGSWYLHRAVEHWEHQADPLPFALAEYNAGASRAQRWSGGNNVADVPVKKFLQNIDFPGTRKYIESIIDRYQFYQRRGKM